MEVVNDKEMAQYEVHCIEALKRREPIDWEDVKFGWRIVYSIFHQIFCEW